MKFSKKFKKAFTLVELVIVIAVIAILSAVSVVTYTAIIKKAHESNDNSTTSQLNYILHIAEQGGETTTTAHDAFSYVTRDICDKGIDFLFVSFKPRRSKILR